MRLAAKGGGLEGGRQDGGDKVDLGSGGGGGGGGGGGLIEEGGELVQLRGGGELGRELRLRETFLAELSRWDSHRIGAIFYSILSSGSRLPIPTRGQGIFSNLLISHKKKCETLRDNQYEVQNDVEFSDIW